MVEGKISVGCVPFNSAPEWVQPEEPEFGPGSSLPTKASDVHGFGVIAWEVWTADLCGIAIHSHETGSRRTTPVLRDDRSCSNVFDAERG